MLFLCRTWEPEPERDPASAARALINDSRAECIAALRKAFGDRCIAGFSPSAHALAHYPQAVVTDPSITERRRYVQLMRSVPICVATLGLHRSNGWKLAEYIASSRAIVCEELQHDVPNLLPGRNFLPFKNASECVERVGELMESTRAAHRYRGGQPPVLFGLPSSRSLNRECNSGEPRTRASTRRCRSPAARAAISRSVPSRETPVPTRASHLLVDPRALIARPMMASAAYDPSSCRKKVSCWVAFAIQITAITQIVALPIEPAGSARKPSRTSTGTDHRRIEEAPR